MRGALAVALALAGTAALAQDNGTKLAPTVAPSPEPRPDRSSADQPAVEVEAETAPDAPATPPARPGTVEEPPTPAAPDKVEAPEAPEVPAATADDPRLTEEESSEPPLRETLAESDEELSACLAALDELGVVYERADPVADPGNPDCGMVNPVTVSQVAPDIALDPSATVRCETALAGARWVSDAVLPLSRKLGDRGPLVALDNGTAYLCRPRADGETSEHAYGNALDIMGFRFESGDPITVQPRGGDGTIEEAFQRAVRSAACLDFTTVLGPGSDADHRDHLHLDVKARDGGFRICQ